MENLEKKFLAYLEESKKKAMKEADDLFQDGRGDEGKFLKIKANMYDIFKALFQATKGQSKGDMATLKAMFLKKADLIPENWRKSLALAKEHNEVEKILTEELKLKTAEEILQEFHKLYEESEK